MEADQVRAAFRSINDALEEAEIVCTLIVECAPPMRTLRHCCDFVNASEDLWDTFQNVRPLIVASAVGDQCWTHHAINEIDQLRSWFPAVPEYAWLREKATWAKALAVHLQRGDIEKLHDTWSRMKGSTFKWREVKEELEKCMAAMQTIQALPDTPEREGATAKLLAEVPGIQELLDYRFARKQRKRTRTKTGGLQVKVYDSKNPEDPANFVEKIENFIDSALQMASDQRAVARFEYSIRARAIRRLAVQMTEWKSIRNKVWLEFQRALADLDRPPDWSDPVRVTDWLEIVEMSETSFGRARRNETFLAKKVNGGLQLDLSRLPEAALARYREFIRKKSSPQNPPNGG